MVRYCPKSSMRLTKDSDVETPGYWFRTAPRAKVINQNCSFRSRITWERGEKRVGVGEVVSPTPEYGKGGNPIGYDGHKRCGSEAALLGGGVIGRDTYIETNAQGVAECCDIPVPVSYNNCTNTFGITGNHLNAPAYHAPGTLGIIIAGWVGFPPNNHVGTIAGWDLIAQGASANGRFIIGVFKRVLTAFEPAFYVLNRPDVGQDVLGVGMSFNPPTANVNVSIIPAFRPTLNAPSIPPFRPGFAVCYWLLTGVCLTGTGQAPPVVTCNAAQSSYNILGGYVDMGTSGLMDPVVYNLDVGSSSFCDGVATTIFIG